MTGIRLVSTLLAAVFMTVGVAPVAGSAPAAQAVLCEDYPTETIQIMAPASPGGGWDTTARELAQVLQDEVVDQNVEVFNVPGAGGTVGLAQLATEYEGDPNTLMIMGLVMLGAIETNESPVTLEETTPIARLTTEYEVIVVPDESEYETLEELIAAFQEDPTAITWAGGSAGGTDHILVGLIAEAVGVDPAQINYIPYSGGGEALAAILGGQVTAGVSGLGEWQQQIEAGELRALAISAPAVPQVATPAPAEEATPEAKFDIPTLQEQGVDVELANWRGIVAPPGISEEARECIIAVIEAAHATDAWVEVLDTYGWQDYFLRGEEFGEFIDQDRERVEEILRNLGLAE